MNGRRVDRGVVLVTILVVMALCVAVIVAMTLRSEQATRLTGLDRDASQAQALIAAGEQSALSALAQDLRDAPDADGPGEPWGLVTQQEATTSLGHFQLALTDQAARFNLNAITNGSPISRTALASIVASAGLAPEVATRIAAALAGGRPLLELGDLIARAGLTTAEIAALQPFMTCDPDPTRPVNINTAPAPVLAALLHNDTYLAQIVSQRKSGLITPDTLKGMAIILPAGLALRSDYFSVHIAAQVGGATVSVDALVHRWRDANDLIHAVIAARRISDSGLPSI